MEWTEERVARLKGLWGEGHTASQIAAILGDVTRNAVIGKAHRLGLKGRPSPIRKEKVATAAPKIARRPAARRRPGRHGSATASATGRSAIRASRAFTSAARPQSTTSPIARNTATSPTGAAKVPRQPDTHGSKIKTAAPSGAADFLSSRFGHGLLYPNCPRHAEGFVQRLVADKGKFTGLDRHENQDFRLTGLKRDGFKKRHADLAVGENQSLDRNGVEEFGSGTKYGRPCPCWSWSIHRAGCASR